MNLGGVGSSNESIQRPITSEWVNLVVVTHKVIANNVIHCVNVFLEINFYVQILCAFVLSL